MIARAALKTETRWFCGDTGNKMPGIVLKRMRMDGGERETRGLVYSVEDREFGGVQGGDCARQLVSPARSAGATTLIGCRGFSAEHRHGLVDPDFAAETRLHKFHYRQFSQMNISTAIETTI